MVSGSIAVNSTSDVKNQMIDTGAGYFSKNDYVADLLKLCQVRKDTEQVNRLLLNLGTQDKASNWLLEQRNLARAFSKENREIRDLLNQNTVDDNEYLR